jgi:arylsulfatase A-like enzyme
MSRRLPSHLLGALAAVLFAVQPFGTMSRGAERADPPARYAVILVLDGARPGYFNLRPMPHLRALMKIGVSYRQAFVGQMIANTPPSHATIGTGVFPRRHGIMGFWWEDSRTGTVTRPTDTGAVESGALEAVMRRYHAPSIAASVKSAYPSAKIVSSSGHKCYAADAMGTASADYILCALIYHDRWVAQAVGRHRPPSGAINNPRFDAPIPDPKSGFAPAVEQWNLGAENDWTVRYSLWAFRRVHYPRVLMVNLPETDVTGHFAVNRNAVEGTLMAHFDRELGHIVAAYKRAGIFKNTVFVVTADHGMTRVSTRVPFSIYDQAIELAGAGKVYLEADTGAALGIRDSEKAKQVALDVALLGGPDVEATYYKTFTGRKWVYRLAAERPNVSPALETTYLSLVNTSACADGPDVVTIYPPHVTTGDRPVGSYHWVGGHLGPQWDEQHIPLVIAGAGVRHGIQSLYPARLVDIAPTVEALLRSKPTDTDGSVLADALALKSPRQLAAQQRRARWLVPQVKLLEKRSRYTGP